MALTDEQLKALVDGEDDKDLDVYQPKPFKVPAWIQPLGYTVFGVGILVIGGPTILDSIQGTFDASVERQQRNVEQAQYQVRTEELTVLEDSLDERSEIAWRRINGGCVPIVDGADRSKSTSISIWQPVLDPNDGYPLNPSTCIMDMNGMTAIVGDYGCPLESSLAAIRTESLDEYKEFIQDQTGMAYNAVFSNAAETSDNAAPANIEDSICYGVNQ